MALTTERALESTSIRWPDLAEVEASQVVLSYDHESDTLFINFFGRGRNTVSDLAGDYWYLMVDPGTSTVIGLQIEEFLSRAVQDVPPLVRLLDLSELHGITPADVSRVRHRVMHKYRQRSNTKPPRWLPPDKRKRALVRHVLEKHAPVPEPDLAA